MKDIQRFLDDVQNNFFKFTQYPEVYGLTDDESKLVEPLLWRIEYSFYRNKRLVRRIEKLEGKLRLAKKQKQITLDAAKTLVRELHLSPKSNDYRSRRLVRLSVIEEIARNLRAVQDYIEDHDAEFQSESGIYVREYIGEMVSDTDEILNPVLEGVCKASHPAA